jgi:hypothetical protein
VTPPSPPQPALRHCVHAERGDLTPDPRFVEDVDLSPGGRAYQAPYDRREGALLKTQNQHLGQRKLLLSEIQLLTEYYVAAAAKLKKKKTTAVAAAPAVPHPTVPHPTVPHPAVPHPVVVYVGSAPGTHLLFLHQLFPGVKFVLYDGAPFDPALRADPATFELHNEFFVDATCASVLRTPELQAPPSPKGTGKGKGRPLIFVCDIRSDAAGGDPNLFEAQVMRDMIAQERWAKLMRPALSLLKFRPPYTMRDGDKMPYLGGRLRYGIWPPGDSGETRLLSTLEDLDKPDVEWDFGDYERTVFYHNKIVRRTCFASEVRPEHAKYVFGRDNLYCSCFDCLAELGTYQRYLDEARAYADAYPMTMDDVVQAYARHATRGHPQFPRKGGPTAP